MKNPSRIEMPLGGGKKLVVYALDEVREVQICIEEDGAWKQDLVIVGQDHTYDNNMKIVFKDGTYSVKVYANAYNEDFTTEYLIEEYKEEDDEESSD